MTLVMTTGSEEEFETGVIMEEMGVIMEEMGVIMEESGDAQVGGAPADMFTDSDQAQVLGARVVAEELRNYRGDARDLEVADVGPDPLVIHVLLVELVQFVSSTLHLQ